MTIKKTIISKENLPPLSLNGEYVLRYRIVSEDKNRTSHWSPIYYIDAKSTIKQVSGELQGSSSILGMTAIWEDTNSKSLYDMFISYGKYNSETEEIDWAPYFFHGPSLIPTYSFLRSSQDSEITDVRLRVQLSGIEKAVSDVLTICILEKSFRSAVEAPFSPTLVTAQNVGTARAFNDGAASVSFVLPANSMPATSYTVTAIAAGQTTRVSTGPSIPITIAGLASNVTYSISVFASNDGGESQPSESTTVLATTVPAQMSAPAVTTQASQDSLSWVAPANGGSSISRYYWESTDSKSGDTIATTASVSQEGNTSQQYRVRAQNANGLGEWSPYSGSITTPPFFPFFPYFPYFFVPPYFPFFPGNIGCELVSYVGPTGTGCSWWTTTCGTTVMDC